MKKFDTHFFGTRKNDKAKIYISGPSWDCGWYWSFGYLGNRNEHYHLSGYQKKEHCFKMETGKLKVITETRNKHMCDCLKADYNLNPKLLEGEKLWTFCELALTAYALKQTAEVLGQGGSHTSTNPCWETIKNEKEAKRINGVVLPTIFCEIDHLFI